VVHRHYDEEVNGCSHKEKVDHRVHQVAVSELAAIDREGEAGEVLLAEDCGDERREDVLNEGLHDTGEGSANDHSDCQVDHIAASDEVPEP